MPRFLRARAAASRPSLRRSAAWGLLLLLLAVPARGDERVPDYAVDVEGVLYAVDCEKLVFTRMARIEARLADGSVDRPVISDLASTPDGYLYAISDRSLYLVNLSDPSRSQRLGEHGLTGPWGMGAVGSVLVVNTSGGEVHLVDRRTAQTTRVGAMGAPWVASGDVAMAGERLVSSVKDGARREHLVTIDPETGAAREAAPFRDPRGQAVGNVFGLIERGGVLYGLTSGGDVLEIDPATARVKVLRRTGIRWWGATSYMRI